MPLSVNVTVDLSEAQGTGMLRFWVGQFGLPCDVERFKQMMAGPDFEGNVDSEFLIRTIAIQAAAAGVTPDSLDAEIAAYVPPDPDAPVTNINTTQGKQVLGQVSSTVSLVDTVQSAEYQV